MLGAVTKLFGGLVVPAVAAILVGALAALLPIEGSLVLAGAIGLWVGTVLIGYRVRRGRPWHPVLLVLTGLSVFSVTWTGAPPTDAALPDLFLLAALAAAAYCWAQGTIQVPLPVWLVGTACMLLAGELIAELVVPNPPVDPPPSFTPPGPPLVTLARVELALLFVPILVGAVASSWERANLMANLWVAGATVSAAIATVDSVTGGGIGLSITGVQEPGRVAGLAIHANAFALACAMALPVALLRAAQYRAWGRAAGIVAAGILLLGILGSGSRLGIFSAVLAIGLMGLTVARMRVRVVVAGIASVVVLLVVAAFAPEGNSVFSGFDRLSGGGTATGANTQRLDQLKDSLEIAMDHPVTGVGFTVIADAHSLPVQFWESAGFIGILALILYATGSLRTGLRLLRNRSLPKGIPDLAAAATVSIAVWLISGLFQNQIADLNIYVPVGILLGLAIAARNQRSESTGAEHEPPPAPLAPAPVPETAERVPVAS